LESFHILGTGSLYQAIGNGSQKWKVFKQVFTKETAIRKLTVLICSQFLNHSNRAIRKGFPIKLVTQRKASSDPVPIRDFLEWKFQNVVHNQHVELSGLRRQEMGEPYLAR